MFTKVRSQCYPDSPISGNRIFSPNSHLPISTSIFTPVCIKFNSKCFVAG